MEERIVAPDPVAEPEAYTQALLDLLGGRDPIEILAETPTTIAHATAALDTPTLTGRPEPNEWSVEELVGHLFHAEVVYAFRWRLTLRQPGTKYPGYDQDAWTDLPRPPFGELVEAFTALRRADVHLIQETPQWQWDVAANHEERGPESFELAVRLIAGHDIAHLRQLDQTLAVVSGQ
ncbi:MAG: DinB family protein [Actinomycetota bacterium]